MMQIIEWVNTLKYCLCTILRHRVVIAGWYQDGHRGIINNRKVGGLSAWGDIGVEFNGNIPYYGDQWHRINHCKGIVVRDSHSHNQAPVVLLQKVLWSQLDLIRRNIEYNRVVRIS